MSTVPSPSALEEIGRRAGLDAVGVTGVEPLLDARRALDERKARGLHGGMQFTYRNPRRSTEPARLLQGARSIVSGARRYRRADPPPPVPPAGLVARYARQDHYAALRQSLGEVADHLRGLGWRARVVCDDNGLVDRAVAHRAGLGWFGKNANLLVRGTGSWVVLGAVVTDAPLVPSAGEVEDGCGTCRRCVDGCPTGAIVSPGVVDARRCLAWLVQMPGTFPVEHRVALGGRLYGCDDCQEVCPPNRAEDRREAPAVEEGEAWVSLLELLALTDDELLERHGRWYIPERDPRFVRRNALLALGNVADPSDPVARRALEDVAAAPDELLAEHARWALRRLDARAP